MLCQLLSDAARMSTIRAELRAYPACPRAETPLASSSSLSEPNSEGCVAAFGDAPSGTAVWILGPCALP